jgi:hypothetical protein
VKRLTTANIVMHQNAVRFLQFMSHLPDTGNLRRRVACA